MLRHMSAEQISNLKRKDLTGPGFDILGNLLGDHLHHLERELVKIPDNQQYINEIIEILDDYAGHFDKLLSTQASFINKNIETLMNSLIAALSQGAKR